MRTWISGLSMLLLAVFAVSPASAEIGTADAVPAATLLVPYFEVDFNNPNGHTTLFSINNASQTAVLAHVTLWTDWGIPTVSFDVYLTGYDVQTINLRDVFNGSLPVTADQGLDPDGPGPDGPPVISNQGNLSQDINFPGTTGPCGAPYNQPNPTLAAQIANARSAHTGQFASLYNACAGADYGDGVARGYVTVDTVNACNLLFPSDGGYFGAIATNQNVLWGDVIHVNPAQDFAQGETAVHIEACDSGGYIGYVGNGAGHCPLAPGDYTFYGGYVSATAADQREPLATTFATRYLNGGVFTGGTRLDVFRDTKTVPSGANGPQACGATPSWFPLAQTDVVAFDEQENPTDQCFLVDNIAPVIGGGQSCFPLATQRIDTAGGNPIAFDMVLPSPFGWLFLNLNFSLSSGDPFPGRAQAWVTTHLSAEGRFSAGLDAVQLENPLTPKFGPSGLILIP